MIFTDPPYGKEYLYLYGESAKVAERVLKTWWQLFTILGHYAYHKIIHLIEDNSTGLNFYHPLVILHSGQSRAQHRPEVFIEYKPLFWYVKGNRRSNAPDEYISDVIRSEPPDKTGNDWAQSPVEAEYCISKLTVENQIVFDPMMGYATTGIVPLRLNRKFLGVEIDEVHFKLAELRIQKEPLSITSWLGVGKGKRLSEEIRRRISQGRLNSPKCAAIKEAGRKRREVKRELRRQRDCSRLKNGEGIILVQNQG